MKKDLLRPTFESVIGQFFSSKYWLAPADNAALVVFRVVFGFLITCEAWGAICTGWVHNTLIEPEFTFNFIGLDFLQPLPGYGMYGWFLLMGAAGFCVMIGWRYRTAMIVYAILWTSVYLMQKTHYNNHYYMAVLLCWIMVFLPANRDFSLDAKNNPEIRTQHCPRWCLLLLMCQLAIVYFFASFNKMHLDWIQGLPVDIWFKYKSNYPVIGWIYETAFLKWGVVWGGILYDLLIIPLLLWRRTRVFAFCLSLFFHLFNSITFQIGIFPYMMIGFSVFFFEPQTVRRLFIDRFKSFQETIPFDQAALKQFSYQKLVLAPISIYLIIQLLLPLRHFYFPGNVNWTEEGHRMAWRMMLRAKSGSIYYKVKNKDTGKETRISPRDYMTKDQVRSMSKRPDMIWQFAQRLKDIYSEKGQDVAVHAVAKVSLNGRKRQNLIDTKVDLASEPWHRFKASHWIVPLEEDIKTP